MRIRPEFWIFSAAVAGCLFVHTAQNQGAQTAATPQSVRTEAEAPQTLIHQYCIGCHNGRSRTAGLALDAMDFNNVPADAEVWEKVISKLRSGAMPPPSAPHPEPQAADAFAAWLENELDRASAAKPNPGRVGIHRLNRTEYANAVRDLLALEIDSRSVLIDESASESGFDNTASGLSISPILVERYLSAARKISRLAVGDASVPPVFDTYRVPKLLDQNVRVGENLPFASRGGIAVRHIFPVDGEYVIKIRLQRQVYNHILGLGRPHPVDVRLDGERIRRFGIGGDAPGHASPDSFAGQLAGSPEWEKYMHDADAGLEVHINAKAGAHLVSVSFPEFTLEAEGVIQPPQYPGGARATGTEKNQIYYGNPGLDTLSIGGPYEPAGPGDTPSRRKIFVCRPTNASEEPSCAEKILSALARRAYRRQVTKEDIQELLDFYAAGRKEANFDAGIELALTRILMSPEFLVRIERDPAHSAPRTVYRLDDTALASRLSFFLWSSIPDDELLGLAVSGKLHEPEILERQIRRLLADGRSKALVDNFAAEWLNLPRLHGAAPDPDTFPDFDENLRTALEQETKLFIESQIREDRSILDLVRANYTFVNERLARHYDIPNVYGDAFRRVTFSSDEPRGGLLGQGSILTVTSYANRTSPVLRGKWLLENLLAAPPPPPPANVADLKEAPAGKIPPSVRERLEEHRKNPACAVCHLRMDPFGFSLENFDATGKWRKTNEDGTPVDSSSALPDGTKLDGIRGLRTFLLSRQQQFAGALTEKLLAYAAGRNVEYFDRPAIRKITRTAAAKDYRWSAIIEGIVKSVPFQMSVAAGRPPAADGGKVPQNIRRSAN
jgi:mono/diheme cytochrome c family protein